MYSCVDRQNLDGCLPYVGVPRDGDLRHLHKREEWQRRARPMLFRDGRCRPVYCVNTRRLHSWQSVPLHCYSESSCHCTLILVCPPSLKGLGFRVLVMHVPGAIIRLWISQIVLPSVSDSELRCRSCRVSKWRFSSPLSDCICPKSYTQNGVYNLSAYSNLILTHVFWCLALYHSNIFVC